MLHTIILLPLLFGVVAMTTKDFINFLNQD